MTVYPPRNLENNPAWRGEDAGYKSKHKRVYRLRGKASNCSKCGDATPGRHFEWANLTGDYNNVDDFAPMCKPCHRLFDQDRGLHPVGSQVRNSKLTEEIVREARTRAAAGEAIRALARAYGVGQRTMQEAVRGLTWKHVA